MRLDVADDEVDAARAHAARGLQHRVGLADAGAGAEEDAQLAAPGLRLLGLDAWRAVDRDRAAPRSSVLRLELRVPSQRQIQLEHIDARLAEDAEGAAFGRLLAPAREPAPRDDAARSRHARDLVLGGRRRDVRIEAAAGGGHQVDRHRRCVARIGGAQRRDPVLAPRCQRRIDRPLVRAARRRAVVRLRPVADGRPQKYCGLENGWPIRRDPTALVARSRSGCRSPACGNTAWPMPVTTSG